MRRLCCHKNSSEKLSANADVKNSKGIVDFTVPVDHRINMKECEKKDNTSTLLENWKAVEHESDDCVFLVLR